MPQKGLGDKVDFGFENNVCLGSVLIILFIDYVLKNDTNFIKHSAMERIVP